MLFFFFFQEIYFSYAILLCWNKPFKDGFDLSVNIDKHTTWVLLYKKKKEKKKNFNKTKIWTFALLLYFYKSVYNGFVHRNMALVGFVDVM